MSPEEVARILDVLGERLGPTGEHVFALALRQVYLESLMAIALFVVVVLAGAILLPRGKAWMDEGTYSSDRPLVYGGAVALYFTTAGTLAIMSVLAIINLVNPEYAALSRLLSLMP